MALSCAMLASTRLPMPAVKVSDSFWVKVAWIENLAAPDDSLASAELTLVSEVCSTPIKAEALTWVETVEVDFKVTIEPDSFRFWAWAVMRRVPSEDASACTWLVEPSTMLKLLNTAFLTMVVIWSRKAVKLAFSAWRLAVSSEGSAAASALVFNWISRSEMDWPADKATSIAEDPLLRLLMTDAKPATAPRWF